MNKTIRNSLKAVGWMFAGAVVLVVTWIAFGHLILVTLFDLDEPREFEGPVMVEIDDDRKSGARSGYGRTYNHSIMSHLYTPDAAPALPDEHAEARGAWSPVDSRQSMEHAVTGHRVARGSGAMLNFQRYSDDAELPAVTDRAVFEKLTVFLPEDIPGDYGHLSLSETPEIIVFWSRGSPDLDKGQMCAGYARSGEIEYRRVSGQVEAKLSFEIDARGTAQPDGRACEPFTFRHASEFWTREVDRLDAWNGGGWGKASLFDCMPSR
jgi:hypothetical protein